MHPENRRRSHPRTSQLSHTSYHGQGNMEDHSNNWTVGERNLEGSNYYQNHSDSAGCDYRTLEGIGITPPHQDRLHSEAHDQRGDRKEHQSPIRRDSIELAKQAQARRKSKEYRI